MAKFVETEEDLAKWTDICAGVWGSFGASLPIEGLTEAANETVRTGQVTGVLADALNWSAKEGETFGIKLKKSNGFVEVSKEKLKQMTEQQKAEYEARKKQAAEIEAYNKKVRETTKAEDFFNMALEKCTTEQERQALITETLNGLYSESAGNYRENNKSIIEAREATSEYTDKVAELGEKVEPITVTVQKGWNRLLTTALELVEDVDFDKLGRKIEKGFDKLAEDIIPAVIDGFEWIIDNWKTIQAGLLGAFSAVMSAKLVLGIAKATSAFKVMFATIKAFTMTNPIGLIATAVGLLVGGIVALSSATEKYNKTQQAEIDAAKESAEIMRDKVEAYKEAKKATEEEALAELSELGHVKALNEELKLLTDEKGRVAEKDQARVDFILGELKEALGTEYSLTDGVIKNYQDMQKNIDLLIEKKKAQIMLDAYEEDYANALKGMAGAQDELILKSQERDKALEDEAEATKAAQDAYDDYIKFVEEHPSGATYWKDEKKKEYERLQADADAAKEVLKEKEDAYNSAREQIELYFQAIERYETGSALMLEGKTTEAIEYLESSSQAFKNSTNSYKDANRAQAEELRTNYENAKTWEKEVTKMFEQGVANVTEKMVKDAEEKTKEAKEEWETVGVALIKGTITGLEGSYYMLERSAVGMSDRALNAAISHIEQRLSTYAPDVNYPQVQGSYGMLPKMATGGVVRSATRAIIGEAGAEAVLPLERNTGWADILADKLSERMGAGGVVVNQTNHYAQTHSQYELYKSQRDTLNAVKLAMRGAYV